MMILGMGLEMFRQVFDPFAQQGNLDFRGSRVGWMCTKLAQNFFLLI
jgi:hypothetical protein